MSRNVDVDDVQSLVFSGHARLRASVILGFIVRDAREARRRLAAFAERELAVGFGDKSRTHATQLLLTAGGVGALGNGDQELAGFSRQFRQGMVAPQRSRALGDSGPSGPGGWAWSDAEIHVALLIYAESTAAADALVEERIAQFASALAPVLRFPIALPADGREPFGFVDGLTVARVDVGDGRAPDRRVTLLPPGEIVLGYENASGIAPPAPPLGENGSLVVLRQLEQDVRAFWDFWRGQGRNEEEAVWLASKALGRWPNGMPVNGTAPMPQPAFDEAVALAPLEFQADGRGRRCPFGAHIRRANPRDGLLDNPAESLAVVEQHRIMRRGRIYGPPVPPDWYPAVVREAKEGTGTPSPAGARGLLFACLCADLARQFEFIQQTWLNNPKFSQLYDEVDPIAAGEGIPGDSRRYSIPAPPLRRRLSGVKRWVRVRGGGYFLLPGRRALLRFLAVS